MAICEKCGKEFEARGDWQKICIDCYKASAASRKTAEAKKTAETHTTNSKGNIDAVLLRKAYDTVVAEFADVIEDVKPFIGAWTTTIALSATKR